MAIPDDWIPLERWVRIRPLAGVQPGERVYGLEVVGDALIERNIADGDILVFIFGRQGRPGDLCVVQTQHGLTAKFVYPNDDGEVILKSANARIPDQVWLGEDLKILGVVERVEHDLQT